MNTTNKSSSKKVVSTYIIWLFLGWFGLHRLYIKKYLSGIIMMLLGAGTVIYNIDIILYTLARILWVFSESPDLATAIPAALLYMTILLSTNIVIIFTWWLIDSVLIFLYFNDTDPKQP